MTEADVLCWLVIAIYLGGFLGACLAILLDR